MSSSEVFKINLILFACMGITLVASNTMRMSDAIGFPEVEENTMLKNKDNRKPVFAPKVCPENELFYPGDQKDDWICDCRPAHIYQPQSNKCWPAFTQGPCETGQYLILPTTSVLPVCEKNPCELNSFVKWNDKCHKLGDFTPCQHLFPPAILGVNATDLSIGCVVLNQDIQSRFGEIETTVASVTKTLPGSKKNLQLRSKS